MENIDNLPIDIVIATHNSRKMDEMGRMLFNSAYQPLSLKQAKVFEEVEETGTTFKENAILKAETYGKLTGRLTLADDSGIEVDALDGFPGIYSARYGGQGKNDNDRNQLLLTKLDGVSGNELTARFRCVVALWNPIDETVVTFEGKMEGSITRNMKGKNGFGYDPLFFVPEKNRTLAELTSQEKESVSHRGKAMREATSYMAENLFSLRGV
ncbi:MAG: XTP/dITP diphosphohydrolase [Chloroflexi bacterium]|nr:MAG: XTP/dITP diphosphohydrolase [Chloroflexota bacterium]